MARLREFDTDVALDQITCVFWEKGYEGTSISDLMCATGLNKQSLYTAFGNKSEIYMAALKHYEETRMTPISDMLKGEGTPRERVGKMLQSVIAKARKSSGRRGCMIGNAAVDHAALDKSAQDKVLKCISHMETSLTALIGEIATYSVDKKLCRSRARALLAGYFGMQVMTKAGVSTSVLKDVRDMLISDI